MLNGSTLAIIAFVRWGIVEFVGNLFHNTYKAKQQIAFVSAVIFKK